MVHHDQSIVQSKFFSRACAHTRSISLTICFVFSAFQAIAADPAFIRGTKGEFRGLELNYSLEAKTRTALKIQKDCIYTKKQATAGPMTGSQASILVPHLKAQKGTFVLEGVAADGSFKLLDTEMAGAYKNFPVSMPGDAKAKTRYPLAITFTMPFQSQGDLLIQKGDSIGLRNDGQLYAYVLPAMTIKNGQMLRLYVGTDDTLYYDAALTHPLHEGKCKKRTK